MLDVTNAGGDAVGTTVRGEILIQGYKRILAKISADGTVVYKELNSLGYEIGTFVFP